MKTYKELKEEYRRKKFRMGVFKIVNKTNGKIFLVSSTDLHAAWNSHRFRLEAGIHENSDLQNDWKQSGAENFVYEIVEELNLKEGSDADPGKEIKALEELLTEELQPFGERGYNRKRTR
jgi:hypothetical protein